jgi:hypothetical protein
MLSGARGARSDPPAESKHPYLNKIPAVGITASRCDAPHRRSQPEDPKYHCVYIMGSLSGNLYNGFSGTFTGASSSTNSITLRDSVPGMT